MSLFDQLKTLTFHTREGHGEAVRFCEKEGRIFVLLSDIWRLCRMTGDKAAVVGIYVKAKGRQAAHHFVFRSTPPDDALISRDVAERMVSDWTRDAEDSIFAAYPISVMFERAGDGSSPTHFDAVALRLEVDLAARAMLSNWGRPGSGFPALESGQSGFLRRLTMQEGEVRRAKRVHRDALRFFELSHDTVFDRIQHKTTSLHLRSW